MPFVSTMCRDCHDLWDLDRFLAPRWQVVLVETVVRWPGWSLKADFRMFDEREGSDEFLES